MLLFALNGAHRVHKHLQTPSFAVHSPVQGGIFVIIPSHLPWELWVSICNPQIRTWTVKLYCVLSVAHGRVNQGEREVTTEHISFPSLGLQPCRFMFSVLVVIVETKSSKEVTSHPLRSLSLPSGGILAYHSSNGHSLLCWIASLLNKITHKHRTSGIYSGFFFFF